MLSLTKLLKKYGDTHLDLCGVQGDNVFLQGCAGDLGYDLVLVHIKSSGINKSLVIRSEPKHKERFPNEEFGVELIKIPIIESVRVMIKGADKPEIIYSK